MFCPKCRVLFYDGKCRKCGLIHRLRRLDIRKFPIITKKISNSELTMTSEEEPKKKRQPNKWQIYLKGCLKDQPKDSGLGERVSACSVTYKDIKIKNPKHLDDLVEQYNEQQKKLDK